MHRPTRAFFALTAAALIALGCAGKAPPGASERPGTVVLPLDVLNETADARTVGWVCDDRGKRRVRSLGHVAAGDSVRFDLDRFRLCDYPELFVKRRGASTGRRFPELGEPSDAVARLRIRIAAEEDGGPRMDAWRHTATIPR